MPRIIDKLRRSLTNFPSFDTIHQSCRHDDRFILYDNKISNKTNKLRLSSIDEMNREKLKFHHTAYHETPNGSHKPNKASHLDKINAPFIVRNISILLKIGLRARS